MNIYITLDYELFFGSNSGTVEKCIIEPIEELLKITKNHGIKFTCFVDSGYLIALEKYMSSHSLLKSDYIKVTNQIKLLANQGHGIELHIHPHWEDSHYDGDKWIFDTTRYRLSHFEETEINNIITRYTKILKKISGKSPIAYRAGGWSAQPFSAIKAGLKKNHIWLDSTVYPGGKYFSKKQSFDFSTVPQYKTMYKFTDDLTVEEKDGEFTEFPISSQKVSPFFFWRFIIVKFLKRDKHLAFGDGSAIKMEKKNIFKLLLSFSHSVVSIDGYKASLLNNALINYELAAGDQGNFVLIGHPKAFTKYSLKKLKKFIANTHKRHHYKTFQ